MSNSIIVPSIAEESSYVIRVEETAETKFVQPKTYSNTEALKKIADYLESTTAYLRKRRLAIK